ncbi:MAG: hypothetical protein AB8B87_09160 [Granulosicoccus sp.]
MSQIGQPSRHLVRNNHLTERAFLSAESADARSNETSLTTSVLNSGNSSLLRSLDSNSRRNVLPEEGESAQNVTGSSSSGAVNNSNQPGAASQSDAAVTTAISTDSSGIQATNAAIANDTSGLEAARAAMQEDLKQLASDPKAFHEAMRKSFGDSYDQTKAEAIRQQVLNDDFSWMPDIQVVDESVLQDQSGTQSAGGGLGAYSKDNDTIYISRQLLQSDPDKAAQILTEEVGHALDARLNTSDAAGDEGDIFARLVGGEEISEAELSALKSENDSGVIVVDGKEIEVEFGWLSKTFKKITKPFRSLGKAISRGFSAITDLASDAWNGIKKGFKKLMQSKIFNTILMIAQFIPIPVVQIAVRVINIAKAAYSVYQGVKHGSAAMILGGVAGVAGGVGGVGKMLGASSGFVDTATRIATTARTAGAAYQAIAKGDFAAAAGLASNYFGGSETSLGRTFGAAGQVVTAVDSAKSGDILGAIQSGQAAYEGISGSGAATSESSGQVDGAQSGATPRTSGFQGFIDNIKGNETFKAISENVSTIRGIVKAVKEGDYSDATNAFLINYGDDLGIGQASQETIRTWAGVIEKVNDTRELVEDGNYSQAIGDAAALLGIPLSQNNQNRLDTVFQIRDSVLSDKYSSAARQAASLSLQSGQPDLAANFLRLANLLDGKLPQPSAQTSVNAAA